MAVKYYTADWHLNSAKVLKAYSRPFPNIAYMNSVLVSMCNLFAKPDDIVIHIGDFFCYGKDEGFEGINENPHKYIQQINATFINIEGNHDKNNKVKSIGRYVRTSLGPFADVSISHYPSTSELAKGTFLPGDIHLCGHVHNKWKYLVDTEHQVLNINMGIDVWHYKIVSEDKLIQYIKSIISSSKRN